MVGSSALAVLCLVIGFGLGRLRSHALLRYLTEECRKPRGGRAHTVLLDRDAAIEIWKQTFIESSQIARDFFKWLIGTCTAGLSATVAILAVKPGNTEPFKAAALAFALALIVSAMPTARLTTRLHNKAQQLGARIARTGKGRAIPVSLPYVWRPGKQTWVEFFAIFMLAVAIYFLLEALVK